MAEDKYLKFLRSNTEMAEDYYARTFKKSEQQKKLEELVLLKNDLKGQLLIGDFGCGSGSLGYYLSLLNPEAQFELVDYNSDAIDTAKKKLEGVANINLCVGNLESLKYPSQHFDVIFCWQTLSWLQKPQVALSEMIRVLKPGGVLYLSALLNVDHDVDLKTEVFDHTRGTESGSVFYNTYSTVTLEKWLQGLTRKIEYFKFNPDQDFHYEGRGLGSFTLNSEKGKLQFSAGMLMNWYFVRIEKAS